MRPLIVVCLLGLVVVGCSDEELSPIETVEEMYTAYEDGDVAGFLEPFAPDGVVSYRLAPTVVDLGVALHNGDVGDDMTIRAFESFVTVDPQIVRSCNTPSDLIVECDVDYRDSFYTPAGIGMYFADVIEFDQDGAVLSFTSELPDYQILLDYHKEFLDWVESEHPDVYLQADIDVFYALLRPSAYKVLVPYVSAFVDQSDTYPVN